MHDLSERGIKSSASLPGDVSSYLARQLLLVQTRHFIVVGILAMNLRGWSIEMGPSHISLSQNHGRKHREPDVLMSQHELVIAHRGCLVDIQECRRHVFRYRKSGHDTTRHYTLSRSGQYSFHVASSRLE
jgi:glutamine phosphoribosylpyrophosphate amidotransferase